MKYFHLVYVSRDKRFEQTFTSAKDLSQARKVGSDFIRATRADFAVHMLISDTESLVEIDPWFTKFEPVPSLESLPI